MKIPWRYVLVVAALMLAAALLVGCQEEVIEPFPDMTPPAAGAGGVRGHMHGGPTNARLCSEEWQARGRAAGIEVVCPGSEWNATIDPSQNDLFFFDGLEPGDYWLIGARGGAMLRTWYMIGAHGDKVTVDEGQWTDVPSFDFEGS